MKPLRYLFIFFAAALSGFISTGENISVRNPDGGGEYVFQSTECLSDEHRAHIQEQINKNIEMLRKQGKIMDNPDAIVNLQWPLKKAANLSDFGYYGISNYLDQNNTAGLLDWNCGTRTYNGHKGLDVFSWPFGWYKMDNNQVEVIAGAPGTIIYKNDGQFDRSCAMNGNVWNAVYVRHADNSVAWYGHLKKNSVTTKNVGDQVALGEYLGIMGSSGNSTGPHLHLEIYTSGNVLVDPFSGTCNSLNAQSWWAAQKPYYEPKINALLTHKRNPLFPPCPGQETLYVQNNFNPGDSIYFIPYYADQQAGMPTQYSVLMPNGTVWASWSHSSPVYYSASYWWWTNKLPANAMHGTWTFRAVFNSVTYNKPFNVGATNINLTGTETPSEFKVEQNYPNPFNPSTKIKFHLPSGINSQISIDIFNSLGEAVNSIKEEMLDAGVYEYTWDASGMPSGIYYFRVSAGGKHMTRKMLLIK